MYDTPIIRQALQVSAQAHAGQLRKGTSIPYIIHPVGVMLVLAEHYQDEELLAAALLHDVIEDCSDIYSYEDMLRDFGADITRFVKTVSKDESIPEWRTRNEHYLETVRDSNDWRAVMVMCADKINNLTDILEDYRQIGDKLWDRFSAGLNDQIWWYESAHQLAAEKMPAHSLVERLGTLVAQLKAIRPNSAIDSKSNDRKYKYEVFVDDNYHYMDEGERYCAGEFKSADKAVQKCKQIVDRFLKHSFKPGMTAEQLYQIYVGFGEDPYIVSLDPAADTSFSAWDYAKERCDELLPI